MALREYRHDSLEALFGLDADLVTSAESLFSSGKQAVTSTVEKGKAAVTQAKATAANPIAATINTIEFRSAFSPPVTRTGESLWDPKAKPPPPPADASRITKAKVAIKQGIASRVKPTILIDSPYGKYTVAPYGVASPTEWKGNIAAVGGAILGALGLLFGAGYLVGKHRGARSTQHPRKARRAT